MYANTTVHKCLVKVQEFINLFILEFRVQGGVEFTIPFVSKNRRFVPTAWSSTSSWRPVHYSLRPSVILDANYVPILLQHVFRSFQSWLCFSLKTSFPTSTYTLYTYIYRVSQEECVRLREGVPYVKVYRYNPKHLCPNLNGYGDNGQRKVWSSGGSTHCTCHLTVLSMFVLECGVIWRQFSSRQP